MGVLDAIMAACDVAGFACLLFRLAPAWRVCGVMAVSNGASVVSEIMHGGEHLMLSFNGSVAMACLWFWWRGGGGDGTRRRLRALRGAFRGVRRTAPVMEGA